MILWLKAKAILFLPHYSLSWQYDLCSAGWLFCWAHPCITVRHWASGQLFLLGLSGFDWSQSVLGMTEPCLFHYLASKPEWFPMMVAVSRSGRMEALEVKLKTNTTPLLPLPFGQRSYGQPISKGWRNGLHPWWKLLQTIVAIFLVIFHNSLLE